MRKLNKLIALALAVLMLSAVLCGCESNQEKIEALSGTWSLTADDSEEQALALLENIDLYEEEIALVDLTTLDYVKIVTFDTNLNYSFGFDVEATKACVHSYYAEVFDTLYEKRTSLNDVYGLEFDAVSYDEFLLFYAELYGFTSFDSLLTYITDIAYDYDALQEPMETGTYTISGSKIMCTITGESQAESLGYSINGTTLTLTYIDAVEVYTKD